MRQQPVWNGPSCSGRLPANLASILARFKPGDTISVTWVSPAGQQTTSTVHLIAGPRSKSPGLWDAGSLSRA